MDAKVTCIPFLLRGKQRKLNEVIPNVTSDEMAHFGGKYLKEIQTKHNKKEDITDGKSKIKT